VGSTVAARFSRHNTTGEVEPQGLVLIKYI
jgi:hypothetical protein